MANRTDLKIDFDLVQEAPPVKVSERYKPIMDNIEAVRQKADNEWWRIARFESSTGAYNRAGTLRKREDMVRFEFKAVVLEDESEGFRTALYCKWLGAKDQPGSTAAPSLRAVDGNGGKRGPGRPRKALAPQ